MTARIVTLVLLALLAVIHLQLWWGAGSVSKVRDLQAAIAQQQAENQQVQQEVSRLASEIENLREGKEIVEEKARSELGMVKPGEIYVHIVP